MSVRLTCPNCGPIHVCDECGKTIPKGRRIEGKIVHHHSLATTPTVWGEWCSVTCLQAAIAAGFVGREVTA